MPLRKPEAVQVASKGYYIAADLEVQVSWGGIRE